VISVDQPLGCLAARGDPPDEDLEGLAAYPDWLENSSPVWAVHQIEELLEDDLDGAHLRAEVLDICWEHSPQTAPQAFDRSETAPIAGKQLGRR
jgi:hypothetical protein